MVGEVRQDFFRASLFLGARGRTANENLLAARCGTWPLHLKWAGNVNGAYAFEVGPHLIFANSFNNAFLKHRILQERRSKLMRAGLHRQADLKMRVRGSSLAEPGRTLIAGNGEQLKPLIIEPQIELAFPTHS